MAKRFNARYVIFETNGTRSHKEIDFDYPENKDRSTLYYEEKQSGRVSRIIANLTGYDPKQIELKELFPL